MTVKQRLMAALQGKEVDRTPWSPFLAYWWGAQPKEIIEKGEIAYLESIGADPLIRGGSAWKVEYKGVNFRQEKAPTRICDHWETPVGTLTFGHTYSASGGTWFTVDHPVQTVEDLKILQWMYEHAVILPDPGIDQSLAEIGERGLQLVNIGCESKTGFQSMLEKWVGVENLYYLLADEPEAVEECLSAMREASKKTAKYAAECAAEGAITFEDSSTTMISPELYEKYIAPEIADWADTLHKSGKMLVQHACGHLKGLLQIMAKSGVDAIESISPPPTGNIDIADAFQMLPENVALIGGIEPVFFQACTKEQLKERIDELLRVSKGRRFVLANSDSCPPGVEPWKMKFVPDYLKGL